MKFQVIIGCIFALFSVVSCNSNVPVLIWNTHQAESASLPAVSALQQISVSSLQARYFSSFKANNILLFLQDALSIEDLSSHGAELEHVNQWMESGHSVYLPNVMQPSQLQHELAQQGYKITSLTAGSAVSELKLEEGSKNLVVVKLPPTLTNPSRSRAIRKADEVMQSVISKVGSLADFTVIYTATNPSVEDKSESAVGDTEVHSRIARSLQQFGDQKKLPPNFHNGSCIMMLFRSNISISVDGMDGTFTDLPETTVHDEPIPSCSDPQTQKLQLNYDNIPLAGTTYYKVKVTFVFTLKRSYYKGSSVIVELQENPNSLRSQTPLLLTKWTEYSAPVGKSFSCANPITYRTNVTDSSGNDFVIRLNNFQAEAFIKTATDRFSQSWDCVGFFTIGIWAGLLSTFLAILILSFGLTMLANIKTMDRFDDPKGKTIVVPNAQD